MTIKVRNALQETLFFYKSVGGNIMNDILIFLASIVLVIVIGSIFKVNIGFVAIVFAYLLSVSVLDVSISELFQIWPAKLFLIIFSISVFYSFASSNGAIEKLAIKFIYRFRTIPALIPIGIFIITVIIAGSGGGPYVATVVMAPITLKIAAISGMSPILGVIAVVCGASGISLSQLSVVGQLVKGLIERTEYSEQASSLQYMVFSNAMMFHTFIFILFYFIFKGYKLKPAIMEKPLAFTREQTTSISVIAIVILLYLSPNLLGLIFPNNTVIELVRSKFDFTFAALIGATISFILKLGNEKEIFKKIPWSTLMLVTGMGLLVGVGEKCGIIQELAELVGTNVTPKLIPVMMAGCSGLMSFISDGPGVVYPTLYPLVSGIADVTGINPGLLFSAVSVGDSTTVISPFSTGGAMFLSFVAQEKQREKMFMQFMIIPFVFLAILIILISLKVFIYGV